MDLARAAHNMGDTTHIRTSHHLHERSVDVFCFALAFDFGGHAVDVLLLSLRRLNDACLYVAVVFGRLRTDPQTDDDFTLVQNPDGGGIAMVRCVLCLRGVCVYRDRCVEVASPTFQS